MSKEEKKKVIKKTDWVSSFNLIGTSKINDFTFKIDERSTKSNWIYNSMGLGVDCGDKFGTVYCELMGGYSEDKNNVIYAHGKKEDGTDDFETHIEVDWDDRFNDDVLENLGDLCFVTVGLEKTTKGKTFIKKFLSPYDAIAYIKENLTEDMVINVKGNLKYSMYQDKVQVKKNITKIELSTVDDVSKYAARFTQTILLDKDSASLKKENIDKDKGVMYVNARVLDYVKEVDGIEVKGQVPYNKQFEYELDLSNEELCKKVIEKLFKVKKDITQITFEGELVEGGATVVATLDDVPDEIKDLIGIVFTEEQAIARCSTNGSKEQRMILRNPSIKLVGDDKVPVLQKFEGRYTEDDLYLDYLYQNNDNAEEVNDTDFVEVDESLDWLNSL